MQATNDHVPTQPEQLPAIAPHLDLYESDAAYRVELEMPGVVPEEIEVNFQRGRLSVSAHRAGPHSGEPLHTGFGALRYQRHVDLGDEVDPEQITANYERGILAIELGKRAHVRPRRIPIQA
jgi:HSP20 family protein